MFPINPSSPCSVTRDTRPSPRNLALEVQPKIDVELEGSESCLEKEAEPTAKTKKAIETVICGSWVGSAGAKHCRRVFNVEFVNR